MRSRIRLCGIAAISAVGCLEDPVGYQAPAEPARLGFVEWTEEAGLSGGHPLGTATTRRFRDGATRAERALLPMAAGLAVGDVDGDGWMDLFALRGEDGGALFQNLQDGTFAEVTDDYGLSTDPLASGPLFADFNGDGRVDLLLGGVGDVHVQLWLNAGKSFRDATQRSRLRSDAKVLSVAAGDPDGDGDLDVVLTRPYATLAGEERREAYFQNDGTGRFTEVPGLPPYADTPHSGDAGAPVEVAIAASFADVDGDGDPDLAVVQDEGLSQVLHNEGLDAGVPVFEPAPGKPTDVPFAHGAAFGDYDNDGDLDWFVSAVSTDDLSGFSDADGNRLYQNDGDGAFSDVTDRARLRDGSFGWGSCFADFDNDGHLDIYQVNGWGAHDEAFDAGVARGDTSRLFRNQRNRTFLDVASAVGLQDSAEGRAVVCFDYDHDGDVDIVQTNADGSLTLWGNTTNPWFATGANYVCVSLIEELSEFTTVGARVSVSTSASTQTQQVLLGSYVAQTSTELHFGIGNHERIDRIDIEWSDGDVGSVENWSANSCLEATHLAEKP